MFVCVRMLVFARPRVRVRVRACVRACVRARPSLGPPRRLLSEALREWVLDSDGAGDGAGVERGRFQAPRPPRV